MTTWLQELNSARPNFGYGVTFTKSGIATLAAPPASFKPQVDKSKMAVTAVLTTRTPDRQGDVIEPAGGDFSEHRTNPVVMFHHGKTHKLPIGKAEDKDGNYTVRLVKARDGADVLLGTTHFAQSNRFAQDVFGLVAEDVLRGVSIGFDPLSDSDSVDELGPSPVLKRPALHFKGWKLLEYSHTPLGVNRDALTVAVEKALDGSRPMHPDLVKFFRPLSQPKKTVVSTRYPSSVRKAMEPEDDDVGMGDDGDIDGNQDAGFDPASDDPSADPSLADAGGSYAQPDQDDAPSPTVQSLLDASQGLMDLCTQIEGSMKRSEHMKGRKFATKLCGDLRSVAAEAKTFADKVKAELSGPMDGGTGDGDADDMGGTGDGDADDAGGMDGDDAEPAPEPETDDDGAIVSKGYTPRRWTFADMSNARQSAPAAPGNLKAIQAENKQLKNTLERLLDDIEAGNRRRR